MNEGKSSNSDSYKSFMVLEELSKGEALSQRDLSKRLHIALGLVNSYIRNLVSKGYITVRHIPAKRYVYYLSPKGFAEKTRLTYHHLHNFTNLYRVARRDYKGLFDVLSRNGAESVAFAGVDESAEIAYLSLQEFSLRFAGIADIEHAGSLFFRHQIMPLEDLATIDADFVVLSSFGKKDEVYAKLLDVGLQQDRIMSIFPVNRDRVMTGGGLR